MWLPSFATDRLNRNALRQWRNNPARVSFDKPLNDTGLATVTSVHGGQRLMAVSPAAQREGVQVGQSLADARALYPALTVRHADPAADLKALDSLSAACERYTPWVALDLSLIHI